MTGLKRARIVWTIVFLGVTLAAIVMECVAGLLHPAGTIPWTEYLARYVPWPIQLAAYVALAVWLPFHFWRHDHLRKVAYDKGHLAGRMDMARKFDIRMVDENKLTLKNAHSQHLRDELASRGYDVTFHGG